MGAEDEFAQAIEIISGLYYFLTVKRADSPRYSSIAQSNICYCIDDELLYEPFFADFGPLNLGRTYRFCQKTKQLLQEAEKNGKRVYLYAGPHAHQKANAAVLVGIYQVIYMNRTADVAYKPLSVYKPFVPFRDASCGVSTFHLMVYDVLRGIQRARDVGFIDWNSGSSTWSLEEYEYYEQVENGDLNWIVPGKFVAFSGPAARSNEVAGYRLHTPEDYWEYFRRRGVTAIVRLNKKVYDRKRFLDGGFKHHEMYFPDGSCPSDAIIQRFLDTTEAEPGAVAVHCKAGLGRTGLLICMYIMKHYRFTAEEVIGYMRVCRPGTVIGPQQNFIREMESRMWQEGDMYRASRGMPKGPGVGVGDLMIAGRAAGHSDLVASATPLSAADAANGRSSYHAANGSPYSQIRSSNSGGVGRGAAGGASFFVSGSGNSATASGGAAAGGAASDMSLLQYGNSKMQYGGSAAAQYGGGGGSPYLPPEYSTSSSPAALGGGAAASGGAYGGGASGYGNSVASVSSFRSRYNAAGSAYINGNGGGVNRSMTPLRYSQQASTGFQIGGHHHSAGGHYNSSSLLQAGAATRGSIGMSSVSRSITVPPSNSVGVSGAGRAPSTGRLSVAAGLPAPPNSAAGAAGLRSTLHTDTLSAADRPKLIPERNTQSADMGAGFGLGGTSYSPSGAGGGQASGGAAPSPWRISVPAASASSSGPGTPTSIGSVGAGNLNRPPSITARTAGNGVGSTGASAGAGGVARMLAPNGQPRKVPVALLNQYVQQSPQQQSVGGWAGAAGGGVATALGGGPKTAAPTQMRASYSYGMRQ